MYNLFFVPVPLQNTSDKHLDLSPCCFYLIDNLIPIKRLLSCKLELSNHFMITLILHLGFFKVQFFLLLYLNDV